MFSLSTGGKPATAWDTPKWEAENATGNRGQTLALHERMLKFIATAYPKQEAVTQDPYCREKAQGPPLRLR